MGTYLKYRRYLVEQCGDLRTLHVDVAYKLAQMAIDRNDVHMLEALSPIEEA